MKTKDGQGDSGSVWDDFPVGEEDEESVVGFLEASLGDPEDPVIPPRTLKEMVPSTQWIC